AYVTGLRCCIPEHKVNLAPFLIDKHEVTNREFARFLDATQSVTPEWKSAYRKRIWGEAAAPDPARLDWPVVRIDYDVACDYAAWRGARLPLEEELEFLGRGHSKTERPAGWDLAKLAEQPLHAVGADPLDHALPPYESIVDVYGNAGEITLLRYRWYNRSRLEPRLDEASGIAYVVRGGWASDLQARTFFNLGSIRRGLILPAVHAPTIGFRCARSVTPRFPIEEVPHAN
ncbi:MAG: SUMF1/EgtB/PvdO family nonheme iron enzyme, partial [Planctomycetota bacterium]|nr:SUMF1/EgtB/PvdO family nonheme iron enzyme [Planctomycetota bacterium]